MAILKLGLRRKHKDDGESSSVSTTNKKETKVLHRAQNSHMQRGHKENMYYVHGE